MSGSIKLSISVPKEDWEILTCKYDPLGPSQIIQSLLRGDITDEDRAVWHESKAAEIRRNSQELAP